MSLQQQDHQVEHSTSPASSWVHYCAACSGVMRLVMATPSEHNHSGAVRLYHCEYLCDCGYREIFEEAA